MSIDNEEDIWYNYGVNGIQGITVNNVDYVFRKNVFGDVTHIYKLNNRNLTLAAKYTYDAWGKCLVENVGKETIGDVNPIRYRGYYYDKETELYYLNARYYDPETGRFISADNTQYLEPNTVNGLNLYEYCASNPVMNVDPSGCFFVTCLIVGLIVGAVIGAAVGGKVAYDMAKESGATGWELFGWTVLGVFGGAVVGGAIGAAAGAVVGGIAAGVAALGSAIGGAIGGTGAFALASGGVVAGGAAVAISIGGAVAIGVSAGLVGLLVLFSKRDPSTNKPSWVNPDMVDSNLPAQENATNILNEKYGLGNWSKGPGTEFSKIVKWIVRYVLKYKK